MKITRILVVDDEALMRSFLQETLERKGLTVDVAEGVKKATAFLKSHPYDLVLTDLRMPDGSGLDLLKKCNSLQPQALVVIMTAFGSIENAVEAMQKGAFNYLLKPFTPDTIEAIIEKGEGHLSLVNENHYLREIAQKESGVIAESRQMKQLLKEVEQIANSHASVLIRGESGTGKEVVARAIHALSPRKKEPYICVNCAAIPDTLIESEFFGHEKGAFTGATNKRHGRFELAHTGTLLLDEVTEIPLSLQPKLLRVLQERTFERVGGSKPIEVDVRIISTTNRDPKEAIEEKLFREDLFYRLNVIPLYLPPLRERKEDIAPLASHFLSLYCQENHKPMKTLSPKALERLCNYPWPGNIRELGNLIERTVVLDHGPEITPEHLHLV